MRPAAVLLLVAAGCRSDGSSTSGSVQVMTYAGDRLAPGIQVIASSPTGEVLDEAQTGALGDETLVVEADSLVTAVFAGYALTTTVPAAGALALHGPDTTQVSTLVVGTVSVDAPALADATHFDIDVGCSTIMTTSLPTTIDITACSQGSDTNVDVLVTAFGSDVLGVAAGHVPLIDNHATFAASAWAPPPSPPLTVDGVGATIAAYYFVDGNAYAAPMPEGVERSLLVADTGAQRYERYVPGLPSPTTITADDFLAAGDGDVMVFRVGTWIAIVPPQAAMPAPPQDIEPPSGASVQLSLDSSDVDGFDAAQAAGFHATTIVTLPTDGTVRATTWQ
jgi:hypothetical protein